MNILFDNNQPFLLIVVIGDELMNTEIIFVLYTVKLKINQNKHEFLREKFNSRPFTEQYFLFLHTINIFFK